jgi:phosphatidylglycerol lysyltransferase
MLKLWQLFFVLFSTTWLWAPYLNHLVSSRTTLISNYEASVQPYGWIFRICDIIGALLLVFMARTIISKKNQRVAGILLMIIGIGLVIDSVIATTCHIQGSSCVEIRSLSFYIHALESGITWTTLAVLGVYDVVRRKRWVSVAFVAIQMGYGLLFITGLANEAGLATLSQFIYETTLVIWIAWLSRELITEGRETPTEAQARIVKSTVAMWAFVNGIAAIIISLAHIHLLGKLKGLYFAGDSAWLAQHGVVIGVTMLYLSRHLARGEMRARQIFLVIAGVEVIKYSVITPHPGLMMLYLITFLGLFIFRDEFDRGTIPLNWGGRLKDLYTMAAGLLVASFVGFALLDRDSRISSIASRAFEHLFTLTGTPHFLNEHHLRSLLLARTVSVFLIMSITSILWILFKPYRMHGEAKKDPSVILGLLKRYSNSSEDYFKLWPSDKQYFQTQEVPGFVAYKIVGSIAFALANPISSNEKRLLEAFTAWCKNRRLTTCLLPIYESNVALYQQTKLETIQIGASAFIDIRSFLNHTITSKWWRWQRNRSQKSGYQHQVSTPPHSDSFVHKIQQVSDEWLTHDRRLERGFSLGYFDAEYIQSCPIHYLTDKNGTIIAFTNQLPQFNPGEIVTIDLLRYKASASGAMSYLLYKTIEWLSENQSSAKIFDLGFVPFAKTEGPLLRIAKTMSANRFSSKGLEQFKNKFEPDWQPNYMAYDGDVIDLASVALGLERVMTINTDS